MQGVESGNEYGVFLALSFAIRRDPVPVAYIWVLERPEQSILYRLNGGSSTMLHVVVDELEDTHFPKRAWSV